MIVLKESQLKGVYQGFDGVQFSGRTTVRYSAVSSSDRADRFAISPRPTDHVQSRDDSFLCNLLILILYNALQHRFV